MPIVNDERRLATIESIGAIDPIEGADAIEAARVRGWTVVVKKGEFAPGDLVVFFEIDSALPLDDDRFAFLAARGSKRVGEKDYHILKTARLRGVYSQGLALPLSAFFDDIDRWLLDQTEEIDGYSLGLEVDEDVVGLDVSAALGVGKYEPPLEAGGMSQKGSFPTSLANKTDAERVQNLTDAWDAIRSHEWEPTLKVDGTSLTVARDHDGALRIMSRNWEVHHDQTSVYSRVVARHADVFDALAPGEAVQAEIVGPGIQGNRLGLADVTFMVFAFVRDRQYVPRRDWPKSFADRAVPLLEVEFPASPAEAIAQVEGMKHEGRQVEGIVWHTVGGEALPELGGRNVWKAINNKYLLKG